MNIYRFTGLVMASFLLMSCDSSDPVSENTNKEISTEGKKEDGMIDGNLWTLARLSDSFDSVFTISDAHKLFGNSPSVSEDGDFTEVIYGIDSSDLYQDGVRMTTISLLFEGDVLIDARIAFTTYGDPQTPRTE